MTDWIANSEAGSSVRAKLNSIVTPITSFTITTPVAHVDFALPSGFELPFKLTIDGVVLSSGSSDPMHFYFSADGGATWNTGSVYDFVGNFSDPVDGFTVCSGGNGITAGVLTSLSLADIGQAPNATFRSISYIYPGSGTSSPYVDTSSRYRQNSGDHLMIIDDGSCELPSILATQNTIRIQIGDDLSGDTMRAGTFTLYGIKLP
jgi:hypothetical protein